MPSALLLPVLTSAAVLVVSGVAKLRDPSSVDAAFTSMRVPGPLAAPWARRVLPWVEVALGLWLLVATGAALVVVAALVTALFATYLVLVVRALRGPAPADCGCFGSIGESRVTTVTLWRNVLLVGTGLLSVVAGLGGVAVISDLRSDGAWAWLLMAGLTAAVAVLVTWRAGEPATSADSGPEVDADGEYVRTPIPRAEVLTEAGDLELVSRLAHRSAHVLVFLNPGCGPCGRIGPDIARWDEDLQPVSVRAVLAGQPRLLELYPYLKDHVWFDPHAIAREAFAVGAPSAVLLGADGLLAGGPVQGEDEIREFVAEVAEHLREAREAEAEVAVDGEPVDGAEQAEVLAEPVSDGR
jgi:hypothetical protein